MRRSVGHGLLVADDKHPLGELGDGLRTDIHSRHIARGEGGSHGEGPVLLWPVDLAFPTKEMQSGAVILAIGS